MKRSGARGALALLALHLAACGAPPLPPANAASGSAKGASASAVARKIASDAGNLTDTHPDGNPIPEDALVVDQKPWDLGYEVGKFGGNLVIAEFSDAKTFNWVVSNEQSSSDIFHRMLADLVHINRYTQEPELALAKRYEVAPDGKSMTIWLRKGIRWSDGEPFSADDVVFTWNVLFDPKVLSPAADLLIIDGKPITIAKVDDLTVKLSFPTTVAVPERLLDSIWILPRHKLEASVRAHTFSSQWGVGMDPADFVTLGPFRLKEYQPGQKTVMERNPEFWKLDRERRRLPYLDGITFLSVPDWNAVRLKYESLETHVFNQVRPEDYAALKAEEAEKDWTVYNLGPSLAINFLWFNQNQASGATVDGKSYMVFPDGTVKGQNRIVGGDEKAKVLLAPRKPYVDPVKLAWFRDGRFRQAVAHATDRAGIIRSVFYSLGVPLHTFLSPGDKSWFYPRAKQYAYDLEKAKGILEEAGYRDRDGDGVREDGSGHPIAFQLTTNKGNEAREKMANILNEDLTSIGMKVDFKPIDFNSLITKLDSTFDYEACVLSLGGGDVDPSSSLNVLKSSGFTHQWAPFQPKPSYAWEKRVDDLLTIVQTGQDDAARHEAWYAIEEILNEEQPLDTILSVKLLTSARNCVGNLRPAVMDHYTLHNQELLYFKY